MNKLLTGTILFALLSTSAQADIINFDFTGRLVVAGMYGDIVGPAYTPIAASLQYDTTSGIGASSLSITMEDGFLGMPATFHDISMTKQTATIITGNVFVDWGANQNMPLHVEWDGTGLFNAISQGLGVGDVLSGNMLYHDNNGNKVFDAGIDTVRDTDLGSATPYSDSLQLYGDTQGPAPLAATINSMGLGNDTPFPGIRGYLDIGSGNSMHVTSVSSVPVPAAVWLLGSGLIGLVGMARRRTA